MRANILSKIGLRKLKKYTNHIIIKLLFLTILFFGLHSCQNTSKNDRDHLVFRYNEHANITSLDPAFAKDQRNIWPCNQLYNSL